MQLVNYRIYGESNPKTIYILHGIFGMLDNWHYVSGELSKQVRVVSFDARNHGKSFHSVQMGFDEMADDLIRLLDHLKLDNVIVLGHSMGGKTVMHFAQENEFLVERLIVVDMGIKGYPPHHDRIFEGLYAVDVESVGSRKEAEEKLAPFIDEASTLAFLMKNLYWIEPGKLAWRFNLPVLKEHIGEIIGPLKEGNRMTIPTLFLKGENSHYIVPADYDSIVERFTQAEIRVINGAGHWPHAEQPTQFIEEIKRFVL